VRKLLTLSTLIVIIDQITKMAIKGFHMFGINHDGMMPYESIPVIGDTLRWTFVENPGMAFGFNFGMPVILSLFSIIASIFLVVLMKRTESQGINGLRIALALILGGAAGNLIDRSFYGLIYDYAPLFYGKVVDFIDFDIPDINLLGLHLNRFYVFNIADAAVSVGVVLLLLFYPSKKEEPVSEAPDTPSAPETERHPVPPDERPYVELAKQQN
jgi:signal peptidase II